MVCPYCAALVPDAYPVCGQCGERHTFHAEGVGGKLQLRGRMLIIRRRGTGSFLLHGLKGDKEIPVSRLTAVQFKEPGSITNGYVQFTLGGGKESRAGLFAAVRDENTVVFRTAALQNFRAIKLAVMRLMELPEPVQPVPVESTSTADELARLAELHGDGHLTDEEFASAKRKLLDA